MHWAARIPTQTGNKQVFFCAFKKLIDSHPLDENGRTGNDPISIIITYAAIPENPEQSINQENIQDIDRYGFEPCKHLIPGDVPILWKK